VTAELLRWLEAPRADAGIRFADGQGDWRYFSYAALARRAQTAAAMLVEAGAPAGSAVSIALGTGPEFPATFFGVLLAGLTPNPVAPPASPRLAPVYPEYASQILRQARPAAIVTDRQLEPLVAAAARLAQIDAPLMFLPDAEVEPVAPRRAADVALLQFSSGSTGPPRGIAITRSNLEHNVEAIRTWLEMTPADGTASWLPLHHDMGLIGCLVAPIVNQSPLWLMQPRQFIKDPLAWLSLFGRGEAVLTAGPSFGYAVAGLQAAAGLPDGMDFSAWRAAIVGAERIEPQALDLFCSTLEPYGFDRRALLPAYGLAEATLVASRHPLRALPRALRPDWSTLTFGARATIDEMASIGDPAIGDGSGWLVGCGTPIEGTTIDVVGPDGEQLPSLSLGEIVVRGPSVAKEYVGDSTSDSKLRAGALATGDAGIVHDGELFVLGRMGDALNVRGRSVFIETIESRLVTVPAVPVGRFAALGGHTADAQVVAVVAEAETADWAEDAARALRAELGSSVAIRIVLGPRGSIQRTSSGKPRRRAIWRELVDGPSARNSRFRSVLDWPAEERIGAGAHAP
jgi:acyl-CoA synthetase (AMP-forming)/AMP-acid ligase II